MISKKANAKINLALHVTGKRTDGYHLLDSLVVFASTYDVITIKPAKTLELVVSGPRRHALISSNDDNLVMQSAIKLQAFAGVDKANGAIFQLDKHLPISAGIGGGSANAAATFHALNEHWNLGLSDKRLAIIGLPLGADIPVCISGLASRMTGIGNEIENISHVPQFYLVLVNSGIDMPTPKVFATLENADNCHLPVMPKTDNFSDWLAWLENTRNDLEKSAFALEPSLRMVKAELKNTNPLLVRMSGSGATFFGVYKTPAEADSAAKLLKNSQPNWWVEAVNTV